MIEDTFIEPTGRPVFMKCIVNKVQKAGKHGYWIHATALTKTKDRIAFYMADGTAIPPIGLEFSITFDWKQYE